MFSADISKSKEISRWRPINKTLHYDFEEDHFKWWKFHSAEYPSLSELAKSIHVFVQLVYRPNAYSVRLET